MKFIGISSKEKWRMIKNYEIFIGESGIGKIVKKWDLGSSAINTFKNHVIMLHPLPRKGLLSCWYIHGLGIC